MVPRVLACIMSGLWCLCCRSLVVMTSGCLIQKKTSVESVEALINHVWFKEKLSIVLLLCLVRQSFFIVNKTEIGVE